MRGVHRVSMGGAMTDSPDHIKAPFPWFGGKSRVAADVWDRFGDVTNYVEPFYGSGAVLLARPHAPRIETVNDLDRYVANFWRCLSALRNDGEVRTPDELEALAHRVAMWCDWPVNEADLHARHRWLVEHVDFREKMRRDPFYFDPLVAGWWVWGLCAWIGSGWCNLNDGQLERHAATRPAMTKAHGEGINTKSMRDPSPRLPMLGGSGDDARGNAHPGRGINSLAARPALYDTFARLAARLRYTRVACGDWRRVLTDSVTWRHGTTGIFLDPPYGEDAKRAEVYAHDSGTIAADVRAWCAESGSDKRLRIALCGYAGEGHEMLEALGWDVHAWKAKGGYGGQRKVAGDDGNATNENAAKERIWFSPGCESKRQRSLF